MSERQIRFKVEMSQDPNDKGGHEFLHIYAYGLNDIRPDLGQHPPHYDENPDGSVTVVQYDLADASPEKIETFWQMYGVMVSASLLAALATEADQQQVRSDIAALLSQKSGGQ